MSKAALATDPLLYHHSVAHLAWKKVTT